MAIICLILAKINCIKQRTLTRLRPHEGVTQVELEGVEPSSAQGNHTLSTRLSWPSFSSHDKTQATNRNLIP